MSFSRVGKMLRSLQTVTSGECLTSLSLCFLIYKVEIRPRAWKPMENQWVRESKVPSTVPNPFVTLQSVSPSPLFTCVHISSTYIVECSWQTFTDNIMKTLYSSKHWMQRIAVYFSNQHQLSYYSSIRRLSSFWPSRDIARRQHLSSLTAVTDLIGLVITVDSLGDRQAVNTLENSYTKKHTRKHLSLLRAENC